MFKEILDNIIVFGIIVVSAYLVGIGLEYII